MVRLWDLSGGELLWVRVAWVWGVVRCLGHWWLWYCSRPGHHRRQRELLHRHGRRRSACRSGAWCRLELV